MLALLVHAMPLGVGENGNKKEGKSVYGSTHYLAYKWISSLALDLIDSLIGGTEISSSS